MPGYLAQSVSSIQTVTCHIYSPTIEMVYDEPLTHRKRDVEIKRYNNRKQEVENKQSKSS